MIRALLVATLSLASSACGPLVTAGNACTTRADCTSGYDCFQKQPAGVVTIPGGFCSRGCAAEADTRECPAGTACTFFGDSNLVCSPQCTADSQCRQDYVCGDVAGGSAEAGNLGGKRKTCRPKGVTR